MVTSQAVVAGDRSQRGGGDADAPRMSA